MLSNKATISPRLSSIESVNSGKSNYGRLFNFRVVFAHYLTILEVKINNTDNINDQPDQAISV